MVHNGTPPFRLSSQPGFRRFSWRALEALIPPPERMKVLITGAGGFLGRGLISALENEHTLRLMDVTPISSPHETMVGDVADFAQARAAVSGMDAVILSHMASRKPGVYTTPSAPFDITVKGTAHVLAAAQEQPSCRVVLISSTAVVEGARQRGEFLTADTPPGPTDLYALTKTCQESIARFHAEAGGLPTAVLRPAYIVDADTMRDKYGKPLRPPDWQFIDRRDIGKAARLALALPDLQWEIFYILGHPDADHHADVAHSRERLGWTPDFGFRS